VRELSIFCLEHSAESEACDMLMEIEGIDMLLELVTEDVHERVCLYLIRYVGVVWLGVWS
jgi:26S proteasome regulatory subunit N1